METVTRTQIREWIRHPVGLYVVSRLLNKAPEIKMDPEKTINAETANRQFSYAAGYHKAINDILSLGYSLEYMKKAVPQLTAPQFRQERDITK